MKIVFMGTPEFAVATLDILYNNGYKIVGVITSTDKYGGRGKKELLESDVKRYAVAKNLKILQPQNLKSPAFVEELRSLNADLQIVVAFRMLPQIVWNMPRYGTLNLHGSLLPKYRGAAPINWAIINGEKETGLTTFLLQHEIDTGDILLQAILPIDYSDTAGTLHDKMMILGSHLMLDSVKAIESGTVTTTPQQADLVCPAPKLNAENCIIDFNQATREVYNFIRGLNPYPGAYFPWESDKIMKIFACQEVISTHDYQPGKCIAKHKALLVATKDGFISILQLQLSGKRRMTASEFLNGNPTLPE